MPHLMRDPKRYSAVANENDASSAPQRIGQAPDAVSIAQCKQARMPLSCCDASYRQRGLCSGADAQRIKW